MNNIEPSLDTWTIIFLIAAGQGIFLAGLFFFKSHSPTPFLDKTTNHQLSNTFLGLFILTFALTLIDYVGFWTNYNLYVPHLANLWQVYVFLFGPLLFLYLKATQPTYKWRLKEGLHFLPALLFILYKMPYWILPASSKANSLTGVYDAEFITSFQVFPNIYPYYKWLVMGHLGIYTLLVWRWVYLLKKGDDGTFYRLERKGNTNSRMTIQWYQTLATLFSAFVLAFYFYYALVALQWLTSTFDYMISFAMTIFIYAVAYLGYQGIERVKIVEKIIIKKEKPAAKAKYQNSSLTETSAQSLLQHLLSFMETEEPYLDNELRLATLAEQIQSTPHHVSQVINEQLGKSFPDFVNEYRVKAAQEMLLDPDNKSVYIINIAYSVGFNNKTSFNKAFKHITGTSPSAFKKSASVL